MLDSNIGKTVVALYPVAGFGRDDVDALEISDRAVDGRAGEFLDAWGVNGDEVAVMYRTTATLAPILARFRPLEFMTGKAGW